MMMMMFGVSTVWGQRCLGSALFGVNAVWGQRCLGSAQFGVNAVWDGQGSACLCPRGRRRGCTRLRGRQRAGHAGTHLS